MTINPCTNAVAGILVIRDERLLLIERAKPPYAWAPPAGHVDPGETHRQAAERELHEEVGLRATRLRLLLVHRYDTWCRRPGDNWHQWAVYKATTEGDPVRSETETRALRWVTPAELDELGKLTLAHLAVSSGSEQWRREPGLEPVWLTILSVISETAGRCGCAFCRSWPFGSFRAHAEPTRS
ncbi:MAG: NUDIX hydrolase [Gammaproteobacteria bacterium]